MESKTTICKQCTRIIDRGTSCIVCEGFCSNTFHPECAKLSVDELLCYRKLPNVFWMCDACNSVMHNIREGFRLQAKTMAVTSNPVIPDHDVVRFDKDIAELKNQMIEIHQSLANTSTIHTASRSETMNGRSSPLAQSSPISQPKLLYGSRNVCDLNCLPNDSAVDDEKFWLFSTKIKNTATERDISEMIADSLGTENAAFVVKKLVSAWTDPSSLPFVSFKVGINVRFKEKAMHQSTWPVGICYREFRDKLWEPALRRRHPAL